MNLFRRTLTMNSCQHRCDKPQLHCWLFFSMFSTLHSVFFRLIVSPASFTPPSEHCPGRHYLTCMLHVYQTSFSHSLPVSFLYIFFFSCVKQETDFQSVSRIKYAAPFFLKLELLVFSSAGQFPKTYCSSSPAPRRDGSDRFVNELILFN